MPRRKTAYRKKAQQKKPRKVLDTFDVFCLCSGSMISSGLFVLPAVLYRSGGAGVIFSFLLAAVMVIPAMLAQAELATAMPRSGGSYFFIGRSLGPLCGAFAGLANWFSVTLKGSFALMGMGAFLTFFFPEIGSGGTKIAALIGVVLFTLVNLFSVKGSGRVQAVLVTGLLATLFYYLILTLPHVRPDHLRPLFPNGAPEVIRSAGMVFIAFGGLTKVAAVAEDIRDPGKSLPKGMFLGFVIVSLLYVLIVFSTVGSLPSRELSETMVPLSRGAFRYGGLIGAGILTTGALLSFITTANASILSASKVPYAMAQDSLFPKAFAVLSSRGVPHRGIYLTSLFMLLSVILLDLTRLIKVASTMMLLLFLAVNLSLILMRESRLVSYRPTYRIPLYPYLPIIGMLISFFLLMSMGLFPVLVAGGFLLFTLVLYLLFARGKVANDSAVVHLVERVINRELKGRRLHEELSEILLERDNIVEDRFDFLIRKAIILDLEGPLGREQCFQKLASAFSARLHLSYEEALEKLEKREAESSTALDENLAIPHLILEEDGDFEIVVARIKNGVFFSKEHPAVSAVFALAGSKKERNFHLKSLMAIGQIAKNPDFFKHWSEAGNEEELRHIIILSERMR